jgi:hypothetical protein
MAMPDMKKLQDQVKDAAGKATVVAKDTAGKTKDLAGKGMEKAADVKVSATCHECGTKVPVTMAQVKDNATVMCTNPDCGADLKARDEAVDKAKGLQEPVKKNLSKLTKMLKS